MRRIKLFVACCLLIGASVPLLPGPGALVIAETIVIMEREFPWVRRLMDAVQSFAQSTARLRGVVHPRPLRELARGHGDVTRNA